MLPDDGVRDAVVHAAQVGDCPDDDSESRRRQRRCQAPDVEERHRPPLEEERNDEDHHPFGRVLVAWGVCVHELSGAFDLKPDGAVGRRHADEQNNV